MPRYCLIIEYDGTGFSGWQRQEGVMTVQESLETAIGVFAGHPVSCQAAGRTDAGVHAIGQCAHVDLEKALPPERVMAATNAHLRPARVAVRRAMVADPAFHARFDAITRRYRYRILNRRAPPALDAGQVWHVPVPLNGEMMHEAAQCLVGRHDFTSFRAIECQANGPVRTLDRLIVRRDGEEIVIEAQARSFLHHQVRNMVGTLKLIGAGKMPIAFMAEVLAARDRSRAGATAPACGLTLIDVAFPLGAVSGSARRGPVRQECSDQPDRKERDDEIDDEDLEGRVPVRVE